MKSAGRLGSGCSFTVLNLSVSAAVFHGFVLGGVVGLAACLFFLHFLVRVSLAIAVFLIILHLRYQSIMLCQLRRIPFYLLL
jgi:hypothetical protein